ncbi:hypothetical protein Q0Z83_056630 [Actinoplanes sichuanensis]|nr:hypothetical protein Q0Z83_056630 [Actinoplanes sichuanensis]
MDSSYMRGPLDWLGDHFELFFYDQKPRVGDDPASVKSAAESVDELVAIVAGLPSGPDRPIHLVAHSWGTYLAIQAVKRLRQQVATLTLISSLPLTWDQLNESVGRFVARVEPAVADEVGALEQVGTEDAGRTIMGLIGQFYLSPAVRDRLTLKIDRYNPFIDMQLTRSIEGYDERGDLAFADDVPVSLIYGTDDYMQPSGTQELVKDGNQILIPDAGHFPFTEQPEAFAAAMRRLLPIADGSPNAD